MSNSCGCSEAQDFDGASKSYKRVLIIIIAINLIMFFVELAGGILSNSSALLADSLDFLGDSFTYTISLLVIGLPLATRAKAGLFKGISLLIIAFLVLANTGYSIVFMEVPEAMTMGAIGFAAFMANVISALLLVRFKDGDSNVRSVWLCSRNDAIGNLAVIAAAFVIVKTNSVWPDIIVALIMASLFASSSFQIINQAKSELKLSRQKVLLEKK